MNRKTGDSTKQWYCSTCERPVDPKSKMIDKKIEHLYLRGSTKNEVEIQNKINEILELLKANGTIL
jgi:hypothetical protein